MLNYLFEMNSSFLLGWFWALHQEVIFYLANDTLVL